MLSRSHSGRVGIDTHSKLISQGFQSVDDRIVGRPRLREIRPELAVDGKLLGQFATILLCFADSTRNATRAPT